LAKFEDQPKIACNPYISRLSAITGNINTQIIDGMVDFLDFRGNIPGKFLLVFDQFINKILQFIDQIDR
jgi:hypothetical protein